MNDSFIKLTLEEALEKYGDFYKILTVWECPTCGMEWENEDAAEYEWCCAQDWTPLNFGYVRDYPDE